MSVFVSLKMMMLLLDFADLFLHRLFARLISVLDRREKMPEEEWQRAE